MCVCVSMCVCVCTCACGCACLLVYVDGLVYVHVRKTEIFFFCLFFCFFFVFFKQLQLCDSFITSLQCFISLSIFSLIPFDSVDDDIDMDKLLMLDAGSKRQQEQQHQHQQPPPPQPQDQPKPPSNKPQMALKPSVPTKPKPACKPTPDKANPKPTIPSKPKTDTLPSPEKTKTVPLQRPTPAPRKLKPQVKDSERKLTEEITGQEVSRSNTAKEDLSSDDIMQYIAANATEEDADLDLFS